MLQDQLRETLSFIESKTDRRPQLAVTLGSGLAAFANEIEEACSIPYAEIPHFSPPTVDGHPGALVIGKLHGKDIALLQGRIHFYEGHSMQQVVYPTRALRPLGVKTLIVTNAAGGLDKKAQSGELMIITDHINLTGHNPLRGPNEKELGPRFPDMSEPYDRALSKKLKNTMEQLKVSHSMGVYCGVSGPCYETAAEVRYLAQMGGRAVGMSTVPEVIAAKHLGLKVVGISCITNLGTGLSPEPLSHDDVKAVAKRVEKDFTNVLSAFIKSL